MMKRLGLILIVLLVAVPLAGQSWPLSPVEFTPISVGDARICAGDDGFLVVWGGGTWAARLDRDGRLLDPLGFRVFPSSTLWEFRVVWTGTRWLVIRLEEATGGGMSIVSAAVSPDYGADPNNTVRVALPTTSYIYRVFAAVAENRVLVAWSTSSKSHHMILDASGNRLVEPQEAASDRLVQLASNGTSFLLVEGTSTCGTYIASLIAQDGTLTYRASFSAYSSCIALDENYLYLSSHGEGWVVVRKGWHRDSRTTDFEYVTLSGATLTVASRGVIGPSPYTGSVSNVVLLPSIQGTEIFFFDSSHVTSRATLSIDGSLVLSAAVLANCEIEAAATSGTATVLLTSENGVTAIRAAESLDGLAASNPLPLTLAPLSQHSTQMVRNGAETLVVWDEDVSFYGGYGGRVFATTLDANGRPGSAPVFLDYASATDYAIGADGKGTYLLARNDYYGNILVRRLGSDLQWLDPVWKIVSGDGAYPDTFVEWRVNQGGVVWDGEAWWVAAADFWGVSSWFVHENDLFVRRFDAELRPLTPKISVGSWLQPPSTENLRIQVVSGDLLMFWLHDPHPWSGIPGSCCSYNYELFASRVSREGALLETAKLIAGSVSYHEGAIASNGTEVLVVWSALDAEFGQTRRLEATRVTRDLVPVDAASDGTRLRGTLLAEGPYGRLDVAWDGGEWVVLAHATDEPHEYAPIAPLTLYRFKGSGDLTAAWKSAETVELGTDRAVYEEYGRQTFDRLAAGGGGPISVLRRSQISNPSAMRLFAHRVTAPFQPQRKRGVRR